MAPDVEITAYHRLRGPHEHRQARRNRPRISHDHRRQDRLSVTVTDPGRGGARLLEGGGLAGLRDRAQAMGGD